MNNKNIFRHLAAVVLLGFAVSTSVAADTANSLCTPGGFAVGFFNGVFNTKAGALDGLNAIKSIDVSTQARGEEVKYELYYNQSGMNADRPGVTRFEDLVEVFRQRSSEQDALLADRWELFWESLNGDTGPTSIWGRISSVVTSYSDLLGAITDDFLSKFALSLADTINNPPTLADYAIHRTLLDAHITQDEKLILIAHSQGNLFMNAAYNYASGKVQAGTLKAVHIAPASPTLNGEYTLANLDLVINALRLTGTVPANNVSIPPLISRPRPFDASGHELVATYLDQRMQPYAQIVGQLQNAVGSAVTPTGSESNANGFFTVTLTWDGAGDIDLHTFEPQGSHVYYSALTGGAGALDTDNTVANGPEHYYASCDPARLQTGTYRVGINNYSGGTGRTATIQLSTRRDGVILTRSMGVGAVRGSSGNASPLSAFNVNVSYDAQSGYKVTASP